MTDAGEMTVVYSQQAWVDGEAGQTPIDASHLNHIETGVGDAHSLLATKADGAHTHTSGSITDFAEAVRDTAAAMFRAGSNVSITYDDTADTLTVNATGTGGTGTTDAEIVRDTIGGALVGGAYIQLTVNDTNDTITIAVVGISADPVAATAGLRSLGTGSQQAAAGNHVHATATTGTSGFMSFNDKFRLDGMATNATAFTAANAVSAVGGKLWFGTQSQYDAIGTKDSGTLYVVS